jgi:hypothetical protein
MEIACVDLDDAADEPREGDLRRRCVIGATCVPAELAGPIGPPGEHPPIRHQRQAVRTTG